MVTKFVIAFKQRRKKDNKVFGCIFWYNFYRYLVFILVSAFFYGVDNSFHKHGWVYIFYTLKSKGLSRQLQKIHKVMGTFLRHPIQRFESVVSVCVCRRIEQFTIKKIHWFYFIFLSFIFLI